MTKESVTRHSEWRRNDIRVTIAAPPKWVATVDEYGTLLNNANGDETNTC